MLRSRRAGASAAAWLGDSRPSAGRREGREAGKIPAISYPPAPHGAPLSQALPLRRAPYLSMGQGTAWGLGEPSWLFPASALDGSQKMGVWSRALNLFTAGPPWPLLSPPLGLSFLICDTNRCLVHSAQVGEKLKSVSQGVPLPPRGRIWILRKASELLLRLTQKWDLPSSFQGGTEVCILHVAPTDT